MKPTLSTLMRRTASLLFTVLWAAFTAQNIGANSVTITDVQLMGPKTIACGASEEYTLIVTGTKEPSDINFLLWRAADEDPPLDDDDPATGRTLVFGEIFRIGEDTPLVDGQWKYQQKFRLRCTSPGWILEGVPFVIESPLTILPAFSSDEHNPVVFVDVMNLDTGQIKQSEKFEVRCVPEPTTMLLLSTGLAGVAMKMRKRLKGHKRGKES